MKKIITTISLFALTIANTFGQYGQVPNGGFENWTTTDVYNYTNVWKCSNQVEWVGVETTVKSTDAFLGTYSAELKRLDFNGNEGFGYVFLGSVGQAGPDPTHPFLTSFDQVRFNYKANITGGDAYVIVIRSLGGVESTPELIAANITNQAAWTEATVNIPIGTQDSMFLGVVLGNPFTQDFPQIGSWAKVDNIRTYSGGVQTVALPDFSLENWATLSNEKANDWYDLNILQFGLAAPSVTKTTDKHAGNFAVRLENALLLNSDSAIALLSLAPFDGNEIAVPYTGTPTTFSGWYKYSNATTDTAYIQVAFYENGNAVGYHAEELFAVGAYTQFTSPLILIGTPDSISINVTTGNNLSSVLFLDDLAFSGGNVGIEEVSSMKVILFPNPATEELFINVNESFDYSIVNMQGQEVMSQTKNLGIQKIDISALNTGSYQVIIKTKETVKIEKLIIQ